jgi:hypothetical protein
MDGSETNFSGWRGAVDEARKGFVADQMNLVRRLNKGAYKWRLWWELQQRGSQFKKQFAKIGDAIFRHNWNLPTWSYIEPVADAQGDAEQLKNALTSPRRLHAARGKDWEEIAEESIEDNAFAIQKAQAQAAKLNAEFPDSPPINWRDLIALPMPAGMTMAMQDPAAVAVQEDAANADAMDAPVDTPEVLEDIADKPQAKAKKKVVAQSDSMKESMLQAEILLHIYGDDAEEVLFGSGPQAAFDEGKVKRDEKGRFASKGSAEALKAAKESLSKALQGDRTRQSARQLSDHLENLTVKQLTELKKEYGIKASGPTKQALIQKLADRLDRGRRTPQTETKAPEKEQEKPEKKPSRKKRTGLTKSETTSDSVRDAYMSADTPEAGVAKLAEWIAKTGQSSTIQRHGMAKREVMKMVTIDGVQWHTAVGSEAAAAKTMSLLYQQFVPPKVMEAIGQVVHTTQKNKDEEYWEKQYGIQNFQSAATGGDGGIVVYSGNPVSAGTVAHEAGHNLATKIWGKTAPATDSEYGRAQQAEKPVSAYGANSSAEDFAEAVKLYVKSPDEMKREFPKKFAALKKIMET